MQLQSPPPSPSRDDVTVRFILTTHNARYRKTLRNSTPALFCAMSLKIYNIRNGSRHRYASARIFCVTCPHTRDSILLSPRPGVPRRSADTLICKRVNYGPPPTIAPYLPFPPFLAVPPAYAVNCALAALSSALDSLLNDYINGSRILVWR